MVNLTRFKMATTHLRYKRREIMLFAIVIGLLLFYNRKDLPAPLDEGHLKGYHSIRLINSPTPGGPHAPCSPVSHIMFLKSHKCASTTVQNLFLKFGLQHRLTFALPHKGNLLGNPELFQSNMIPDKLLPPSGKVDIFAVHTRLNLPEHKKVLHGDTVFVTAVRDPADQFESLYKYFRFEQFYKMTLDKFASKPVKELQTLERKFGRFGLNMMLFDMGIDILPNTTESEVNMIIKRLDEIFNVVLIVEKLDESLILMKEKLCWKFSDIIYLVKNVRKDNWKTDMSLEMRQRLRDLNNADTRLYEYFVAQHELAVGQYGREQMDQQVSQLNLYKDELMKECGVNMTETFLVKRPTGKDKSNSYVMHNNLSENCKISMSSENDLIEKVRKQINSIIV